MLTPFEVIFANIAQGIALLDSDLRVLVINNRLSQLLQIPELTMGVDAKVIADHLPACNQTRLWLTHLVTEQKTLQQEIEVGEVLLSLTSTPVGEGCWLIQCKDISAQAVTRKELSEQTNLFDTALANMPHGLCMFDADKNLMLCNTAYSRLYSLPEQLIRPGTPLQQILDYRVTAGNAPVDRETYFDVVVEAALKRSVASQNISLVDGRVIKISHNPMENGGYVAAHEDVTDAVRADEQIKYMAGHDPLTGLPNRTLLREKIDREVAVSGKTSSLLCLDLDRFKEVNDSLGHAVGDLLLKAVADRLTDCLRDGDSIARLGGDEFVIFQTDVQSRDQASSLAQRIIDVVDKAFIIDGKSVRIGVSIGIAMAPDDGDMGDSLLRHADTALYKAKANGRGTFCFFETVMDVDRQARRDLETVLQQALETNQFELYYQPQVDTISEQVVGFEALLRWHHPERGLVSPAEFIPLAEETGMIVPIGEWVLRQACKDAASWSADIGVAVNLSPLQFKSQTLAHTVVSALSDAGLQASRLELEITESVLLTDNDTALATLHHIRSLGVRIAMDDFGTGYSSLSYLRLFPFDKIKIDQSFIRELGNSKDCAAIVKAVVDLGASLGITTTAEGVETSDQLNRVREQGCSEIQGYFFGKPLPISSVHELLKRHSPDAA
ncbi:putative bifunctional diguanylate cyclase/phosphodiesterase [Neorhizobium galegae]|uniref:putative bifunctional diguanylate cyclase/phosphodiesterase n=1 Tax=Neorhizobium galegae TaxID=399 RepID=UPI000621B2F5|nr:EAL domain-containing protein [Neorhizobium galegae]KAB1121965.1 EAL domain-containing protein [Neorhizobium galegae]MCQ1809407.1 EAL domain-containing protein [Neorhizobium galegae]CDZ63605.1 Putative diguanylate cyclase (GGDEF)/phosphodiesterase (EAL) [Neorhizobium galegae bv. orientalis]